MPYIVEISGLPELQRKLSPTQFKVTMRQGMTNAVVYLEGQIKERTPVRSGELRASITHAVSEDGMEGRVGTSKFYAPFVERGTGVYVGRGRIYPKVKKALAWDGMVRRSIAGMKGRYFVQRTWEEEGGVKLARFFTEEIEKQLES